MAFRGAQPESRCSKDPFASWFVAEWAAGEAALAATTSRAARSARGKDFDVAGSVFVVVWGAAFCDGPRRQDRSPCV
jgi:hypothetical protein